MNHGAPSQSLQDASTTVRWWSSHNPTHAEDLSDSRFDTRLRQCSEQQQNNNSDFSLDVVILTRKLGQRSEHRTSQAVNHSERLYQTFDFPASMTRKTSPTTGYHRFIKSTSETEAMSELVFTVQSPRLSDEDHFLIMKISRLTKWARCIISVPSERDRDWLTDKIKQYKSTGLARSPVYLLSILCEKLDFDNEEITSEVLCVFHKHDMQMEEICGKVKLADTVQRSSRPRNEETKSGEHKSHDENKRLSSREAHMTLIQELNKINIKLRELSCTVEFEKSALKFVRRVMDHYNALRDPSDSPGHPPRMSDRAKQDFSDEIEFLEEATHLRQSACASFLQRSEHWVALLHASNSQRDVDFNKEISENAQRLNIQVRNLTILGSLFIPPSFVASLFGTSVFMFNPGTGNIQVANQWWTLAASAGGLTVFVVLALALCFWAKETPELRKRHCPLSGFNKKRIPDEEANVKC
ncbi:hypothetical protein F5Y16DRAFT_418854 [Xylariaceae sp. FL0255]|nr:hypothetical protein F5Y16DRAFT_418854 [Xylariaceae sp. FL0255]